VGRATVAKAGGPKMPVWGQRWPSIRLYASLPNGQQKLSKGLFLRQCGRRQRQDHRSGQAWQPLKLSPSESLEESWRALKGLCGGSMKSGHCWAVKWQEAMVGITTAVDTDCDVDCCC